MSTTEDVTLAHLPIRDIERGENPRSSIDDDALDELKLSIQQHGVITPITVSQDGEGKYTLIAGQRRMLAATLAGLETIPAYIRIGGYAMSVAENVIRADLSPLDEARAYEKLRAEMGGDADAVARLVGRNVATVEGRLRLLELPEEVQVMIGESITLACVPNLATISRYHPGLATRVAERLAERAHEDDQSRFAEDPAPYIDDVLSEQVLAWSAGGFRDPVCPRDGKEEALWAWLAPHTKVKDAIEALPPLPDGRDYNPKLYEEQQRRRDLLRLTPDEVDAAHAYGVAMVVSYGGENRRAYVTDPEWVDEILSARILNYEPLDLTVKPRTKREGGDTKAADLPKAEQDKRAAEREKAYAERVAARSRNLDVGAAVAQYEPKLTLDEVKLLAEIVLTHHGEEAAWAHRLCVEQPVKTSKAGKQTVLYPRLHEDQVKLHDAAMKSLDRAKTPEAAAAVVLRLLVAHHLVDRTGLPNADVQGTMESYELTKNARLDKLATRIAPASVKAYRKSKEDATKKEEGGA